MRKLFEIFSVSHRFLIREPVADTSSLTARSGDVMPLQLLDRVLNNCQHIALQTDGATIRHANNHSANIMPFRGDHFLNESTSIHFPSPPEVGKAI